MSNKKVRIKVRSPANSLIIHNTNMNYRSCMLSFSESQAIYLNHSNNNFTSISDNFLVQVQENTPLIDDFGIFP